MSHAPDLIDRQPPCDLQAEMGLLGSIVLLPAVLDAVSHLVTAGDFYDQAHGRLYGHLVALHATGRIDPTLILSRLKSAGDFEAIGGAAGVSKIIHAVPNAAHATYYAEIVAEKAKLRRIITSATAALERAYRGGVPSHEIAETLCNVLAGDDAGADAVETIGEIANRVVDDLAGDDGTRHCLFTGLTPLDSTCTLLMPGELVVLAARPGCGKTSLAQQIAVHNASKGRRVLFCSIEMESEEIARRELCAGTDVQEDTLRRQAAGAWQIEALRAAAAELAGLRLSIYRPRRKPTVRQIAATARAMQRRQGLELLIVDYIGLVRPDDARKQRYEQVTQVVGDLKELAVDLGVPLLALCQLNREADKQRPTLANLRESGAIEQDADAVLFLHRDSGDAVQLLVAKNRHGSTGDFWLRFDGPRTRFEPGEPPAPSSSGDKPSRFQRRKPQREAAFDTYNTHT